MNKKKIVIILFIILIIILALIYLFAPITTGPPTGRGEGVVEKAWGYCGQFSEIDCNSNAFFDTNYYSKQIGCYWNSTSKVCAAGIGYQ